MNIAINMDCGKKKWNKKLLKSILAKNDRRKSLHFRSFLEIFKNRIDS